MLLIELSLPSGLKRVSNEPLALEHFWNPVVASCGPIKLATDRPYGGYVRPQFGKLDLTPDVFADDWPPPVRIPVKLFVTDSNESSRAQIMSGTAHRESVARDNVSFDLLGEDYSGRFVDHAYNNTVSGLFAGNIASADSSLSVDTSLADPTNAPHIDYVDRGDQVVIDSLSKACACAGHLFYISGTTAHLIDMLTDNGGREITEFDFFPSSYRDSVPYANFRCGDENVAGSYAYGRDQLITPVFATDSGEVQKGLGRIKQILEAPRATLKMPIVSNVAKFGERLTWVDESQHRPLTAWMRVRSIVYDFDQDQCVLDGEGGISA